MANRISGGISSSGGRNVNPLYRPFKAVSDAVGRYVDNTSEAYYRIDQVEKKYGQPSPQFKKAQKVLQGAVFQNRKPPKTK